MPLNMTVKLSVMAKPILAQTRFVFCHVWMHVIARALKPGRIRGVAIGRGDRAKPGKRALAAAAAEPGAPPKIVCAIRAPVLYLPAPMPRPQKQKKLKVGYEVLLALYWLFGAGQ